MDVLKYRYRIVSLSVDTVSLEEEEEEEEGEEYIDNGHKMLIMASRMDCS